MDFSNNLLDEDKAAGIAPASELLLPISRLQSDNRSSFSRIFGEDLWTAFELSWLNMDGLPQVAIGEFSIPHNSDNIVESKSLKIYLNNFNQRRIASWSDVSKTLNRDLSHLVGSSIGVKLFTLDKYDLHRPISKLTGKCIDNLDLSSVSEGVDARLLKFHQGKEIEETLYTHLLRTNCPVTNQPDWGSLFIAYNGPKIEEASLLAYVVSYRLHQDFHERCVEQIFYDVLEKCKPQVLTVCARYLRRGGIDINPIRSTKEDYSYGFRLVRQ